MLKRIAILLVVMVVMVSFLHVAYTQMLRLTLFGPDSNNIRSILV